MRWEDFRRSTNVEDRRGQPGGGGGMRMGGRGGLGLGTMVVLGLIGWALGIDPRILIGGAEMVMGDGQVAPQVAPAGPTGAPSDKVGQFAAAVLAQTEDVWSSILQQQANRRYEAPALVLFSGATQSGCGFAQAQMGPFYCPVDRKLYIDLAFFADMQRRLGAGGDFAFAYVIAHEVGHHIENLIGILPKVQEMQRRASERDANALSVRVELMADCFAGVWAHHAEKRWRILEAGDLEEALNAAAAVGDDRLQRAGTGRVVPDSFTHGSSDQRMRWLQAGLKSGSIAQCNTFEAQRL
ncbi:MAG: neutral zinc metallopeptidase [Alphaproteobacteria bacterium]|nr:neutral zinc metallopeptidase [Alphaproteobacteria bacterium]